MAERTSAAAPTPLGALVMSGEAQTEAVRIEPYILMGRDSTNSYLVMSGDGDVLINAGAPAGGRRSHALFSRIATGPLRYAVVTQSHIDHYGGLEAFMEADTKLVTGSGFPEGRAYAARLAGFYGPRGMKLWGSVLGTAAPRPPTREFTPDVLVDDTYAFEVGDRRFEVLSTPGGETQDSVVVWLPAEKVVFTSNLFGPLFLHVPNLNTIRGDKPRSARAFIASAKRVQALGAEILITGHGEPIRGAERIRADLDRLISAVQYIEDKTIEGMNAGKPVHTLMQQIALPPELALGQAYGRTAWAVKTIWAEYAGWFHYDTTTALYATPPAAVYPDLVELAGGADALADRARVRLDAGRPLEALHLLDVALGADATSASAKAVKVSALRKLLEDQVDQNFSEIMWLRSEITALEGAGGK